jgi:transcriptional regulator with XRE-family HTH domain
MSTRKSKRNAPRKATSPSGRARPADDADRLALRVGHHVLAYRQEAGITFDAFVAESGVARGHISELQRGLVMPTIGTLARLAAALGVTVADLVCGDSARERCFEELRRHPATRAKALHDQLVVERMQRERGGT